jgi:hemolysin activation/secretion protein
VAKAELQRTQALPRGFEGFAKIDGQFSGSPLISNEQYLAGGVDTVRGYLESEASGDQALHSTLEIRTPTLVKDSALFKDFKLTAFYDVAKIRIIDPTAGQDEKSVLAGVGIGARVKALKNFNANLDLAWPLNDSVVTKKGDFSSHIRLWYEF